MHSKERVWSQVLGVLQEHVNEQTYRTWFQETKIREFENDEMTVHVPTQFIAQYLNKNYCLIISEICNTLFDQRYKVKFVNSVNYAKPEATRDESFTGKSSVSLEQYPQLNQNYKFKDFVVGGNNRFACSAAEAVAESPGNTYNPLFIYGNSGMGKTHLMQAIGHMVLDLHENKKVYYITTEQFTNNMIEGIRSNTMDKFRNKYRYFDVLLIDDIQFLSKREGTQEEFFHTFNALYENGKQIILTSDRLPRDIPELEQRLISRFEWGLLTDLKQPNFETRVAILKKKAERDNIYLNEPVLQYIAENITSNVRALEGSLVKIQAWIGYKGIKTEEITIELAKDILRDMFSPNNSRVTLDLVRKRVCNIYNLRNEVIFMKTRKREIAFPRQVAMYLSNLFIPSLSLKEIANYYKLKDHTTVIHAIKLIKSQLTDNIEVKQQVEQLMEEIKN
ncbi:MAG: chromosomal replication initiator protein DnaA [Candidatus Cloacimonetes bacterium]|nr:chromosomal replication initiator protein DnaA [Candidatus Cloacimonadota bacterium]